MYPNDVFTHNKYPANLVHRMQRGIYDAPINMCMGPPPPKVIAVFYHGGPFGSGKTTTADKANTAGKIYNATHKSVLRTNRYFVGRVIAPGATSASGVANGLSFITRNYQKGDQIIIYAYSYGVDVAVDLCHKLNGIKMPVSLLVTVDGSDGPAQNWTVNTKIPNNVTTNINYYQTKDSGCLGPARIYNKISPDSFESPCPDSGTLNSPGSNGGPNKAVKNANVINHNVTKNNTTHGNIQKKQQIRIQKEINDHIKKYKYKYNY